MQPPPFLRTQIQLVGKAAIGGERLRHDCLGIHHVAPFLLPSREHESRERLLARIRQQRSKEVLRLAPHPRERSRLDTAFSLELGKRGTSRVIVHRLEYVSQMTLVIDRIGFERADPARHHDQERPHVRPCDLTTHLHQVSARRKRVRDADDGPISKRGSELQRHGTTPLPRRVPHDFKRHLVERQGIAPTNELILDDRTPSLSQLDVVLPACTQRTIVKHRRTDGSRTKRAEPVERKIGPDTHGIRHQRARGNGSSGHLASRCSHRFSIHYRRRTCCHTNRVIRHCYPSRGIGSRSRRCGARSRREQKRRHEQHDRGECKRDE